MAEIVNLRRARKARARTEKETQAEQNRLLSSLPKAERKRQAALNDKARAEVEAHRLESAPDHAVTDES